jgi:hypothetical protein
MSSKTGIKKVLYGILDIILIPISLIFLPLLKLVRRLGVEYFPLQRSLFSAIGLFPIRDHYYEPRLQYEKDFDAAAKRRVPIILDVPAQLASLYDLSYTEELADLPLKKNGTASAFYLHNGSFGPGDAELYYLMIRNCKPRKIIEIGSGFSTLLALRAIEKNLQEGIATEMICIEPFEKPWLRDLAGIDLQRDRVENIDISIFSSLQENDLLFIDSSHIIRPGNDVLFIYTEVLPLIAEGVYIHIHDIFTPRHYRQDWLTRLYRFWNEQYLLEAFLYNNKAFEIVFSLNHLKNEAFDDTKKILVHLDRSDEPSSFWLKKMGRNG